VIWNRFSAIRIIARLVPIIPTYFSDPIMTYGARLGEVFAGVKPSLAAASTIEEAVVVMNFIEILPSLMLWNPLLARNLSASLLIPSPAQGLHAL
jgi:hypothetical protein